MADERSAGDTWNILIRRTTFGVSVIFRTPRGSSSATIPEPQIAGWLRRPGELAARKITATLGGSARRLAAPEQVPGPVLSRLALHIDDRELVGLPWEAAIAPLFPKRVAFRDVPVRPRSEWLPFTLPLRTVRITRQRERRSYAGWVSPLVRKLVKARIVLARTVRVDQLSHLQVEWPTGDVIVLPFMRTRPVATLSTAYPDLPGTLGWLERLTTGWQTRLLIWSVESLAEAAQTRRIADALAARGGPAALILEGQNRRYVGPFLEAILRDLPMEAAVTVFPSPVTLYAGETRQDSLSLTEVADRTAELSESLAGPLRLRQWVRPPVSHTRITQSPSLPRLRRPDWEPGQTSRERRTKGAWKADRVETAAGKFLDLPLDSLVYGGRDPDPHIELAERVNLLRVARRQFPFREWDFTEPLTEIPAPAGRFMNNVLYTRNGEGGLRVLPQEGEPLRIGQPCYLVINIGHPSRDVRPARASALLEEVFLWKPGDKGRWVEAGVTALDFTLTGDPVQQLWLPASGTSPSVVFTVTPHRVGIARLRTCLYFDQNVIQSFLLAAVTVGSGDEVSSNRERPARLASALNLPLAEIGQVIWLARMEYSLAPSAEEQAAIPSRTLSVVANDLNGESVITIKGADIFHVRTNADLPDLVTRARASLDNISDRPVEGLARDKWPYAFGDATDLNVGSPEWLDLALQELAAVGYELFDAIVPGDTQGPVRDALKAGDQSITVAQLLLDKVIPWALVYDRPYSVNRTADDAGNPVDHVSCLASLPLPDGTVPEVECAVSKGCALHPDSIAQRMRAGRAGLIEETVACPLHLWGFRHIIELPPQQAPSGKSPPAIAERVTAEGSSRVAVGMHAGLPRSASHLAEIETILHDANLQADLAWKEYDHNLVVTRLKIQDLDVVYLYCHAEGGKLSGIQPPVLRFRAPGEDQDGRVQASDLQADPWQHRPLVILNGCRTAAFSPDALSPFITKLVMDRHASGLLGTEVAVWEQLATEVGRTFLRQFLAGTSAGRALLTARRLLLARRNPLGLAYTLYAASHLAMFHAEPATR